MIEVMDPTDLGNRMWAAPRRRLLVGGLLAAWMTAGGCARLERFQRAEAPPPMLGSSRPAAREPGHSLAHAAPESHANTTDTYAEWLAGRTRPEEPNGIYRSNSPTVSEDPSLAQAAPAAPVQVALQAPLPAAFDGSPTVVSTAAQPPSQVGASVAEDPIATIARIIEASQARVHRLNNYQVEMNRQERVNGQLQPTENVLLSIRRDPMAVRIEWPEGPNKGREVIYNAGGMMQINMPGTLMPRISLPPDSPLALRNSRHPITEAGFATIVDQMVANVRRLQTSPSPQESMSYEGLESPEPGAPNCHKIIHKTPTRETWTVYIDDRSYLPYLIHGEDASGALLEHYVFRQPRIDMAELTVAEAFDPEKRWGPSGGLLGRIAREENGDRQPATSATR